MKKGLLISGGIVLLVVVYLFLLSRRTIVVKLYSTSNIAAASRCFPDTAQWAVRWPKNDGCAYQITGIFYNELRVAMRCPDGAVVKGVIRLVPLNMDTTMISWEAKGPLLFVHKEKVRQAMEAVLRDFKAFIDDDKNIYGVHFYRAMSRITTVVSITNISTTYPTTDEVYQKIDSLRAYMTDHGAAAVDSPWLNVTKMAAGSFKTTVAIPADKQVPENGRISNKRFVPWKMIQGDVRGGVYTVEKAFGQMEVFRHDHPMTIVAIPFQMLITDRRKEQDTTKWVTIVAAPVS
ncbi:MAG TPA: hypothetical protein VGN00_16155 [Puia sp.]